MSTATSTSDNGRSPSHAKEPVPSNMSTSALDSKLRQLQQQSAQLNQELTQKLASSQSGRNLLHIGSSLSSLPPDLHSLLQQLHPVLSASESTEKVFQHDLVTLTDKAGAIRQQQERSKAAAECAHLYADLLAAEHKVQAFNVMQQQRLHGGGLSSSSHHAERPVRQEDDDDEAGADRDNEELDYAASLERAAHITLCLVDDLQTATATVSSLTRNPNAAATEKTATGAAVAMPNYLRSPLAQDSERAQFVLRLAPRIRRLEADTTNALSRQMEGVLKALQRQQEQDTKPGHAHDNSNNNNDASSESSNLMLLLQLGHCMRGLALLGRGKEVESIFARVAIMPLIRSKVSMGRLDQGGSRGECAGLFSLLDDMAYSIQTAFGPVLCLAESMFDVGSSASIGHTMDVDLLTCGVWVPIATALMADAGIKMAIFSPGIASILQANYSALDVFMSELAERLLKENDSPVKTANDADNGSELYFRPSISPERIQQAQDRIYSHAKTAEFSKKWNLPIYYQLRFGECCSRLNKAVDQTKREGWIGDVFSGSQEDATSLKQQYGFELSLFLELYDILLGLWRPDVILRPLTNRFLRGSVQIIGRVVSFIADGMDGTIKFGEEPKVLNGAGAENALDTNGSPPPAYPTRSQYCWGESEGDVAAVAWELTILESTVRHDYVTIVTKALSNDDSSEAERAELHSIISDVLKEASDQIHPLIDKAWNEIVVNILTSKCAGPLAAVKGVAATYRMTNRPPPTQASPFVGTILRPLKEFDQEFSNRTPDRVGSRWKQQIIVAISDRYAAAVEELIATVQRTEAALQGRRTARRTSAGGMSDGEKVKLQLYLDYQAFSQSVRDVGVEPATVIGLSKLRDLTTEGEKLHTQSQNGD